MKNREQLAWALGFCDYSDETAAKCIADALAGILDDDDCSLAIIYGKDLKLLADWLGRESED